MTLEDAMEDAYAVDSPDSPTEFINTRVVKDPIHKLITLSNRAWRFVDTKQFQRLRHVKQLGTSYYVWLGASHNRFEHCLGVAHLARLMASHLQKHQPELQITDRDVDCVELAGLCHDLGHGPWSHVWDAMFIPKVSPNEKWEHEEGSEMMFDYLVNENIPDLPDRDRLFIKKLIRGLGDDEPCLPDEKRFLFDIVANKRNGLDVDKFDYILRDSHMIGDPMNVDLPRVLKSARVLRDQICYDIKDANHLYDICAMRFKLHKIVYNHKAAKAIEYLIIDGLIAAEPYMKIAERIRKPEQYVHLTDNILTTIEETTSKELAPARAILSRIRSRNLYKLVDYKTVDWPHREQTKEFITPEKIVAEAKTLCRSVTAAASLTTDHVVVDFSMMHYGMKQHNPLDFVRFYSKQQPNVSRKAERGDYSTLMPQYHAEVLVRVFTKEPQYFGIIQTGYRACLQKLKDHIDEVELEPVIPFSLGASAALLDFDDEDSPAMNVPTPPQVDAPSTPKMEKRAFSRQASLSFTNNSFTTVPPDFAPRSPSRGGRQAKRPREASQEDFEEGSSTGKRVKEAWSGLAGTWHCQDHLFVRFLDKQVWLNDPGMTINPPSQSQGLFYTFRVPISAPNSDSNALASTFNAEYWDGAGTTVKSQIQRESANITYKQYYGYGVPTGASGSLGDIYIDKTPSDRALYVRFWKGWQKLLHAKLTGDGPISHPVHGQIALSFDEKNGPTWLTWAGETSESQSYMSCPSISRYLEKHLDYSQPDAAPTGRKRRHDGPEKPPAKRPKSTPTVLASSPSLPSHPPPVANDSPTVVPVKSVKSGSRHWHFQDGPYALPTQGFTSTNSRPRGGACPKPAFFYDFTVPDDKKGFYGDLFFHLSLGNMVESVFFKADKWTRLPSNLTTTHTSNGRVRHPYKPNFMLNITSDSRPCSVWVSEKHLEGLPPSSPIPTASDWFTHLLDASPFCLKPCDSDDALASRSTNGVGINTVPTTSQTIPTAEIYQLRLRCLQLEGEIQELKKQIPPPTNHSTKEVQVESPSTTSTAVGTNFVLQTSRGVSTEETPTQPCRCDRSTPMASVSVRTVILTSSKVIQTAGESTSELGVQVIVAEPIPIPTTGAVGPAIGYDDLQELQNSDKSVVMDRINSEQPPHKTGPSSESDKVDPTMSFPPSNDMAPDTAPGSPGMLINGEFAELEARGVLPSTPIQENPARRSDLISERTNAKRPKTTIVPSVAPNSETEGEIVQAEAQSHVGNDPDRELELTAQSRERGEPQHQNTGMKRLHTPEQSINQVDPFVAVGSPPTMIPSTRARDRVARFLFHEQQETSRLICRICVSVSQITGYFNLTKHSRRHTQRRIVTFGIETPEDVLFAHAKSEHKEFWERLLSMTDGEVEAMVQQFAAGVSTTSKYIYTTSIRCAVDTKDVEAGVLPPRKSFCHAHQL